MSDKKLNIKKILSGLLWVTIGIGTVVLLIAAVKRKDAKHCKGIEINISGANNNFFIDKKDVLAVINRFTDEAAGKAIESFNLRQMEAALEEDVWIKNAELFFDNNNILQADVEEREPVARIFTLAGNTFYIDSSAMMLPLSEKFSARVPVFTDFPSEAKFLSAPDSSLLADIRNMSMELQADSFLMAMIDQVDITPQRNFEMIPKIGNQLIEFGDASDAPAKFKKLKLFYKNIMLKAGWNRYSNINLQYDNQVVAKIKGKEDIAADSLRTLQLMQIMAANAAKASADSAQSFYQDNEKNSADTSLIQQSLQRDEIAEPSNSNTIEKPSPQEHAVPAITKPVTTIAKPIIVKPVPAKPVANTAKPAAKKPVTTKPIIKPVI
ncbi:MAG: hypothetical protein ABJA37_14380, partial [Ferruginibacter sp.]